MNIRLQNVTKCSLIDRNIDRNNSIKEKYYGETDDGRE
jgi:hypothetical protein